MKQYIHSHWTTGFHLIAAESKWEFIQLKKSGGTFLITDSRMNFRITQTIKDKAGIWAGSVFTFKNNNTIAFISTYKVGNNAI
jgi:hypothetical protein